MVWVERIVDAVLLPTEDDTVFLLDEDGCGTWTNDSAPDPAEPAVPLDPSSPEASRATPTAWDWSSVGCGWDWDWACDGACEKGRRYPEDEMECDFDK
jgi:hypothetical protein